MLIEEMKVIYQGITEVNIYYWNPSLCFQLDFFHLKK